MSRILLVARREFRQVAMTRAFWITLMIMPVVIFASTAGTRLLRPPASAAYTIVDETGRVAPAIDRQVELSYQRTVLSLLSSYATRQKIQGPELWAQGRSWTNEADVEAFIASGGVRAAQEKLKARLPQGAAPFTPPVQPFVRIDPPVRAADGDSFGAAMAPYLQGDVMTPQGKRPLALAAYISRDPNVPVRVWTNGNASSSLIDMLRDELSHQQRLAAMAASGVRPDVARRIDALRVPLEVRPPSRGSVREQMLIRSALPLGLAYLLLVTVMITSTRMMVGVIEERSNRLLEQVLACITPQELMIGKLIGLGAVGLAVTAVWAGCALVAANATPGFAADYLMPALASLNQPWMLVALIFYYLSGFLIISMIFLAVGSLSNTMQDANAYIAPITMAILMPVILLVNAVLQNPGGTLPVVMSWIPLYTPFAMLARLGSGVSLFEVLGSGVMLAAFVALEVYVLGRVFQQSLLNTGQPLKLTQIGKLMRGKGGE